MHTHTHIHYWLISEANNAFPQCRVIYHCGPGTALQGLRLWTRWASKGKQKSSPELKKKVEKKLQNQAAEMKGSVGLLDIFFPLISLFPSALLHFCSLCQEGKIKLDWRGDDAGPSVQTLWMELPRGRVLIRMWNSQGLCCSVFRWQLVSN